MALGGRADFRTGGSLYTLAAFSWCDQSAPAVVGGENTVIAGEVNPWLRYEGCQAGDEIDRVEGHLGRSIAVGRLQGVDHLAGGAE